VEPEPRNANHLDEGMHRHDSTVKRELAGPTLAVTGATCALAGGDAGTELTLGVAVTELAPGVATGAVGAERRRLLQTPLFAGSRTARPFRSPFRERAKTMDGGTVTADSLGISWVV
jgi:hypothetical protein